MSRSLHPLIAAATAQVDRLGRRDRLALAAGVMAAAIGIEALVLLPMRDRRHTIERTLQSTVAQQSAADASQQADLALRTARLREDAGSLHTQLATLGLGATQRDSLGDFLTRSLRGQGVTLTALKGLPVEPLALEPIQGLAQPAVPAATEPTPAPPALLYRHRAELQIEGPVVPLMRAVDQLERGLAPLRVERLQVAPANAGGATVRATVVLTTINEEPTWLAL